MLVEFSLIFAANTKIIFHCDFVAPLTVAMGDGDKMRDKARQMSSSVRFMILQVKGDDFGYRKGVLQ